MWHSSAHKIPLSVQSASCSNFGPVPINATKALLIFLSSSRQCQSIILNYPTAVPFPPHRHVLQFAVHWTYTNGPPIQRQISQTV
jgi:hypothetical protein